METKASLTETTALADIRELADRCLRGDESAMHELVNRYRSQVFGLCFRMLTHRQDAEDAAQETLVRALRYLPKWDRERSFERWLLAIAGNRCRTVLAQRGKKAAMQSLGEDPLDRTDDDAARQTTEEVHLALQQLRSEYRQAFLLFHEQQLSYAQIASTLDIPLNTIKTWVHRARRDMIAFLATRDITGGKNYELRRV